MPVSSGRQLVTTDHAFLISEVLDATLDIILTIFSSRVSFADLEGEVANVCRDWPPKPFKPSTVVEWDIDAPQDDISDSGGATTDAEAGENRDGTSSLTTSPKGSPKIRTKTVMIGNIVDTEPGDAQRDNNQQPTKGEAKSSDLAGFSNGGDADNTELDQKESQNVLNRRDDETPSVARQPLKTKISMRKKEPLDPYDDYKPSQSSSYRRWNNKWRKPDLELKDQHVDRFKEKSTPGRVSHPSDQSMSSPVIRGLAKSGWLKKGVKPKRSKLFSRSRAEANAPVSSSGESDHHDQSRGAIVRGLVKAGWITTDQRNCWRRLRDSEVEHQLLSPRGVPVG